MSFLKSSHVPFDESRSVPPSSPMLPTIREMRLQLHLGSSLARRKPCLSDIKEHQRFHCIRRRSELLSISCKSHISDHVKFSHLLQTVGAALYAGISSFLSGSDMCYWSSSSSCNIQVSLVQPGLPL